MMRIGQKNPYRDHIAVTAKHIAMGKPADTRRGPIGLALRDAGYKRAIVEDWYVTPEPGRSLSIDHSLSVKIGQIDNNEPLDPFDIVLDFEHHSARVEEN